MSKSKNTKNKEQQKWESYSTVEVDSGFDYANDYSTPEEVVTETTAEKNANTRRKISNVGDLAAMFKKQFKMTRKTLGLMSLSLVTLSFAGFAFYQTYQFYLAVLATYGSLFANIYITWTMICVSTVALSSLVIFALTFVTKDVRKLTRVKKSLLILMFIMVFWIFAFQWALHIELETSTTAVYIIYSMYSIASLMGLFYFLLVLDKKTDFDYVLESKAAFKQTKAFDGTLVYANYNYDDEHDDQNEDKVFIKKEEEKVNRNV